MTKIIAISDTHGAHHKLSIPECDILIHAGDESARGSANDIMDFVEWLDRQPAKHVVWTPGNHSLGFEARWPDSLSWVKAKSQRAHVLINSSVELEGLKIWGSPITPRFGSWAYSAERGQDISQYWDQIPEDTDIVVTHGPPANILDLACPGTIRETHAGCLSLAQRIARIRPKLHIFGHIHEAYGVEDFAGTKYVNASIMDMGYRPVNSPVELEL